MGDKANRQLMEAFTIYPLVDWYWCFAVVWSFWIGDDSIVSRYTRFEDVAPT